MTKKIAIAFKPAYKFTSKYSPYKASDHDDLVRCIACSIKYSRSELQLFGGRLICNYCIKDMEENLTFTGPGRDE